MSFEISPIIGILSAIWLALFLWARSQTERVKERTTALILEQARLASRQDPPTVEQFFNNFQPIWEKMLRESASVILHKSELFPIPARPDAVRRRLNLSPAWLGAYLRIHGFHWRAEEGLEAEIQRILALAPVKKGRA